MRCGMLYVVCFMLRGLGLLTALGTHWGVDIGEVECISASMGNALASIGGFCAGSSEVHPPGFPTPQIPTA
jgi:7-keto-8-aminopelargonate synthetase-like enzyme